MQGIASWLREPSHPSTRLNPRALRWWEEWWRSALLALFTLLWFFVVPVPGLFTLEVFTPEADARKTAVSFEYITVLVVATVGLGILGYWVTRPFTAFSQMRIISRAVPLCRRRLQRPVAGPMDTNLHTPTAAGHDLSCPLVRISELLTYIDQGKHADARWLLDNLKSKR